MVISEENIAVLNETTKQLLAPGKGIMVVDDNDDHFLELLEVAKLSTKNLPQFRQFLFDVSILKDYISGMAFLERKEESTVATMPDHPMKDEFLTQGFVVGMKFEPSIVPVGGNTDEYFTQGLDTVYAHLSYYYEAGYRFLEWNCSVKVTGYSPTEHCINVNAGVLARFASMCQKEGLVPVLEAEVAWGGKHTLIQCEIITEAFLGAVMKALSEYHVYLRGIILKPSIVTCGKHSDEICDPRMNAKATLIALRRTVPPAIPGIAFSCSSLREQAYMSLTTMNSMSGCIPWVLTFSFGQALYAEALTMWSLYPTNAHGPRKQYIKTLQKVSKSSRRSKTEKINEDEIIIRRNSKDIYK